MSPPPPVRQQEEMPRTKQSLEDTHPQAILRAILVDSNHVSSSIASVNCGFWYSGIKRLGVIASHSPRS